jgi:uncharacterized membrane protein (UPF0127 family)
MPRRLDRLPSASLAGGLRLHVAADRRSRLLGLAWLVSPPRRRALLLPRCRSVHTIGMRWPVDLVWLDRAAAVVRIDARVPPWRLRTCRHARAVVEVPAGEAPALLAALAAEGGRVLAAGAPVRKLGASAGAVGMRRTCGRVH